MFGGEPKLFRLVGSRVLFLIIFLSVASSSGFDGFIEATATGTIPAELVDESWTTGEPCSPPCWYGVIPGVSNKEEALNTLTTLPFLNRKDLTQAKDDQFYDPVSDSLVSAEVVYVSYKEGGVGGYVGVYFVKDELVMIEFSPNFAISFEEVVEQIGPPDYLFASPSYQGCDIGLTWVDKQMWIVHHQHFDEIGIFNPDLCGRISREEHQAPRHPLVEFVVITIPGWFADMR